MLTSGRGIPQDKLRLLLVALLSPRPPPPEDVLARLTQRAGGEGDGDAWAAAAYVRRMVGLNLAGQGGGRAESGAGAGGRGAAGDGLTQLTGWAERAFGQGLSKVKAGVKTLLQGSRTCATVAAVDALAEGRKGPETGERLDGAA